MHHIYSITHKPSSQIYIGVTQTKKLQVYNTRRFGPLPLRYSQHLLALARGEHYNMGLSMLWDDDETKFEFKVLQDVPPTEDHLKVEARWIKSTPKVLNERHHLKASRISIMDDETVSGIKEMLAAGVKGKLIADHFGVSTASVSLIKNGVRWDIPLSVRKAQNAAKRKARKAA